MKIKFKWQEGNEYKWFNTYEELVDELRKGNVDEDNESSDDFLINESYELGEWEYVGE
tara:strand:+ start:37 stop:210 length:174 start_codon:yes stop_codon:yes gene_type:complete